VLNRWVLQIQVQFGCGFVIRLASNLHKGGMLCLLQTKKSIPAAMLHYLDKYIFIHS
jgi:hypothetical protein